MLTWINTHDPRVLLSEVDAELWAYVMEPVDPENAKLAVLEFYKRSEKDKATPAAIRKLALGFRETQAAKQQALEAKPAQPERTFSQLQRRVESPEFRALFEQGRREGNAERAYNSTLRETGEHWRAVQARDEILGGTVAA